MPRFFRGRTSKEVRKFLEENGFVQMNNNGDDAIYAHPDSNYPVKIPDRNEVIPVGTMDSIKKIIIKAGFSRKDILKWWKDNGYGE